MSLNSELALASRVLNAYNDRLPAEHKLDLEAEWNGLVDAVNECRSDGAARLAVIEWRQRLKAKVSTGGGVSIAGSLPQGTARTMFPSPKAKGRNESLQR
jgi:hypothetical protein